MPHGMPGGHSLGLSESREELGRQLSHTAALVGQVSHKQVQQLFAQLESSGRGREVGGAAVGVAGSGRGREVA